MTYPELALLCGILLIVTIIVWLFSLIFSLFRPWLQCYLSRAPVPLYQILAMRLRGTPVKMICEQRIKSSFAGEDVAVERLESAYKNGVDIKKIVDALCLAKAKGQSFTWAELVETEMRNSS